MGLYRMPQWELSVNAVNVAAADSFAFENPAGFQFRNDFLHGTFGNANGSHHVSQPHFRVLREAQKDVGVIGEKRPTRGFSAGRNTFFHFGVDG